MPRRPIKDEFQHLKISRQRKYQLRQQRDGRCIICGKETPASSRCLEHMIIARERQRRKNGWKRRYQSTSYKIEAQLFKRKKRKVRAG